jgi:hypothetical protein
MSERSERIDNTARVVTLPVTGSPRKRGACGALSWGGAKEGS